MNYYEWIILGRKAIELENIHEIVKLAVNISTNGELALFGYDDIYE